MYQIGAPTYNQPGLGFAWSEDNMAEVEMGIIRKADTVAELAEIVGADAATLRASLDRWNALVDDGRDGDVGRPPGTMTTVRKPPFYVGEVWPVVSNTQGGPIHDTRQRIIDVFGEPIPRLYAAGELGSAFGHLYMSGGNLAECFIGGAITGRNAAARERL
jgi:succinate dehydrogenase/fumarate reductase flavoprotein subunit